ncbi:hypothetical protein B0T22DRAFT_301927 [Podospora appendiculata]|uniref:Uncharacterized protein n=1 Tax=Podospora appendiculata TaxID=314037 RepID=A0AAE1C7R7_9PEZI|nr:hypothetical protein B0T22DRAFT_301927 [Podospora appendiculata]
MPLQRLDIKPAGRRRDLDSGSLIPIPFVNDSSNYYFRIGVRTVELLIYTIARPWRVERDIRDGHRHEIHVTELNNAPGPNKDDVNAEYMAAQEHTWMHGYDGTGVDGTGELWDVFRHLWPAKEGVRYSKDGWREDWHSFPLQKEPRG